MKKTKLNLKDNKKFWKWATNSLFLILFGTSAILNITFLPKYFALKNNQDKNQILNINISAYNDKTSKTLFTYKYQTTQTTLANLMNQDSETFSLSHNGTWLEAITYYNSKNEKETISSSNPYYWIVYYNGKSSEVGIADLFLHKGDQIALRYQKFNS